jgi:beta-galactosidase
VGLGPRPGEHRREPRERRRARDRAERYENDARLAQHRLHNNALRLSIEWSRIFPSSTAAVDISGGITPAVLAALDALADQTELAHYRTVLAALRAHHLEPMVTLNHFTLPLWLHEPLAVRDAFAGLGANDPVPAGLTRAGWLDPAIVDEFTKFAAYAGWRLGDLVDLWDTINEPVPLVVGGFVNAPGVTSNFPPGAFNFPAVLVAIPNLVAAHARAYEALHATDTTDADGDGVAVAAGIVHNMIAFHPNDPARAADVTGTAHADYIYNRTFLNAVTTGEFDANLDGTITPDEMRPDLAGHLDFVGVNYYFRAVVTGFGVPITPVIPLFDFFPTTSYRTPQNPTAPPCPSVCSDFGWEIYPAGLREVLAIVGALGVPAYITENGIADAADALRGQYIYDHLATLQQAIADGVADVRGYFHWSLTDNFEWASGYWPKFGLASYDPSSGRRKLRAGARPYRSIARHDGISRGLAARYGP